MNFLFSSLQQSVRVAFLLLILTQCIEWSRPARTQADEIEYKVTFSGTEDKDLLKTLSDASSLVQSKKIPMATSTGLIRRAQSDIERLTKVLESYGYYSGRIEIRLGDSSLETISPSSINTKEPQEIKVRVEAGNPYVFDRIEINGLTAEFLKTVQLPIVQGEKAIPANVLKTEEILLEQLKAKAHPYGKVDKRTVTVDTDKETMDVVLEMSTGPWVRLGKLVISGNENVDSDFISKRMPWKPGDLYSPKQLSNLKSRLSSLRVFSSIKISIPYEIPANSPKTVTVPVTLQVKERKRKFVGFGASYSNINGADLDLYWGHRNLFGQAERFKISGEVSRLGINEFADINKELELDFVKPDYLKLQQDLLANGQVILEKFDAFERKAVTATVGLKRQLTKYLSVTANLAAEASEIEDNDDIEEFGLLGIPLGAVYDSRNNLLNPTKGVRHEVALQPYLTLVGPGNGFTISTLSSRTYWDVFKTGLAVVAGRLTLGSIFPAEENHVPSDKKFFAGGGGSIRGYEFQKVGPLDSGDDPLGGLSLIELSFELRIRFGNFGFVPFIDGGNVFESETPDLGEEFQWGAGLGLRYYTNFGPLRLDLGFPINRRDIDEPWAFYISIGQSF